MSGYVWTAFFTALGLSLVLTPAARAAARRLRLVAQPKADRWHSNATPLLGGIAVYGATMAAAGPQAWATSELLPVLVGATAIFIVGIVDDFTRLKPATKLIAQIAIASTFVYLGDAAVFTGSLTTDALLNILWIVGITNAFNLLDNMDGLCAGIGMIAVVSLLLSFPESAAPGAFTVPAALAGALLAFLVYNSHPASIFLGDGGSLFIGFTLSGLTLSLHDAGHGQSLVTVLALPVLILVIPILDTLLVTVARKMFGRAASQGGTDHLSHRLVALGFSERRAVLLLYSLAGISGAAAVLVNAYGLENVSLLIAPLVIGLILLGVALAHVRVYEDADYRALQSHIFTPLLTDLTYKRRVFEVLLDFMLIGVSYYGAYRLRFEGTQFAEQFPTFIDSLPIVIGCKIVAFWLAGVYRGVWRYVGLADLSSYLKGVLLGQAASLIAIVTLYDFGSFSRTVFVIDGLLLLVFLVGSRLSFRALADFAVRQRKRHGRRALVYGAGDAGLVLLKELLNNNRYNYRPVGFLDDDTRMHGRKILGYDVLGGITDVESLIGRHQIGLILLSTARLTAEREEKLRQVCIEAGIPLVNLHFELQPQPLWQLEENPATK